MAMKRTPTPWLIQDNRDLNDAIWIGAEHPEVGFVSHAEVRSGGSEADALGDMEANAAFIVKAVNCHDALVESARCLAHQYAGLSDDFLDEIAQEKPTSGFITGTHGPLNAGLAQAIKAARVALAKAESMT